MFYLEMSSKICGFLIMLVVLVGIITRPGKRSVRNKIFLAMVILLDIYFVVELIVNYMVNALNESRFLSFLGFVLTPLNLMWFTLVICYLVSILKENGCGSWILSNVTVVFSALVMFVSFIGFISGDLYTVEDGVYIPGNFYNILTIVLAVLSVYYGVICIVYRKILGIKRTVSLLMFMIIPISVIALDIFLASKFLSFAEALTVLICYIFVQNAELIRAQQEQVRILKESKERAEEQYEQINALYAQLQEKQAKLEESSSEQEAQLEEITSLYGQLQEKQARLEESSSEQEAQLEEITDLNKSMEQNISIIQSMGQIYFASFFVNLNENSFFEISNEEFVRNQIGVRGNAQESLYQMCDNMVVGDTSQLREFVDFSTLNERLSDKKVITCDYEGKVAGWCQLYIIAADRDDAGNLINVLVASRTIHDEKTRELEQNRKLEIARKEAENANISKTTFLNNMSHDIRTPMNAILGFTDIMESYKDDPVVLSDYLKKIKSSGEYLLTLINNVLDMARIESGNVIIDEDFIDLSDSATSSLPLFEEMIEKKKLHFNASQDIVHKYVLLDHTKIQQITVNLVSNAIKYTPEGGKINVRFEEIPCELEGYATYVMTVSDTGIGMSEEFSRHVFDYFSRERNTTESKVIGTGLGMSIVKKLVDIMGGTITVDSVLGQGTTFKVTLTHKIIQNPDEYIENTDKKEMDIDKLKGTRILLAEDNELNAEIAITLLQQLGFEVDHAEDGVICVDMLVKSEPGYYDCILMDIQMPNLNGYLATKKIRALGDSIKANIPIIAMTANAFDEDRRLAYEAGMNAHLSKPIQMNLLLEEMAKVIK